jgi:hypothetical protein
MLKSQIEMTARSSKERQGVTNALIRPSYTVNRVAVSGSAMRSANRGRNGCDV